MPRGPPSAIMTVTKTLDICETWIEHVAISNNEETIAACAYVTAYIFRFNGDSGDVEYKCAIKHPDIVWKSAFANGDLTLCTSCADGRVYIWDINNSDPLCNIQLEPDKRSLLGLAICPSDTLAAVSSVLGNIFLLCLENKIVLSDVRGHNESVEDVTYSPSGKLLASCAKDGKIKIWSNTERQLRYVKCCEGHRHWVYSCSFSADGAFLLSASADKTIKLWSVDRCECLKTFHGHKGIVWCAQFINKEATSLVSCSSDGTTRIWSIEAGKVLEKLHNPGDLNFADGYPRDQLFWCSMNRSWGKLAIGAYHGKIYLVDISVSQLNKKNRKMLEVVQQKWRTMAQDITHRVLNKSLKIVHSEY